MLRLPFGVAMHEVNMLPYTDQEREQVARDIELERSDRAASLAEDHHQKEILEAEDRGHRRALIDARLDGHEARLNAVNGSIARTAISLDSLKEHIVKRDELQDKRNTEYDTKEKLHWQKEGRAFSKKQIYLGYGALFATVASPGIVELIKLIFG
jgi:hypothetical protein